jgi:hypothetical protein
MEGSNVLIPWVTEGDLEKDIEEEEKKVPADQRKTIEEEKKVPADQQDDVPEEGDAILDEEVEDLAASLTLVVKDETEEQAKARIEALLEAFKDREPCPSTVSHLCGLIEEALPPLARRLRYEFGVTDHI